MNAAQWMLLVGAVLFLGACAGAGKITAPGAGVAGKPFGMTVGIVAHLLSPGDAGAIAPTGIRQARLSYYGPAFAPTTDAQIAAAHAAGLNVLLVCYAAPAALNPTGFLPGDAFQWKNEPGDLRAYVAEFLDVRDTLPNVHVVPAGLSNDVQGPALAEALHLGLGAAGVLCLHAYGSPLENAVQDRVDMARRAGWAGPIWLTEIGTQVGPTQAAELRAALMRAAALGVERTYVYAWASPDDGYSLTLDSGVMLRELLA